MSRAQHFARFRAAVRAARVPRVQLLVWLMLRDHPGEPWQSGLLGKPSYGAFRRAARAFDPRNARVELDTRAPRHVVRIPALELRWHIPARAGVGPAGTGRRGCVGA